MSRVNGLQFWELIVSVTRDLLFGHRECFIRSEILFGGDYEEQGVLGCDIRVCCPVHRYQHFGGTPEDRSNTFLSNAGTYLADCMVSRVLSSRIQRHVVCWKPTDVSEGYIASIFWVKE
jgi:hypothetical protein